MQARLSLVQLMLPFAVESKRLANINGLLPWELAPDVKVAQLLKPGQQDINSQDATATPVYEPERDGTDETYDLVDEDQACFTLPVTAS